MKLIRISVLVVILPSIISTPMHGAMQALKKEILKNFNATTPVKTNTDEQDGDTAEHILFPSPQLNAYNRYAAAFNLLNTKHDIDASLEAKTISDVNLFFYSADKPKYTVLNKVYRGWSLNGKLSLGLLMVNPLDSIESLRKRQKTIRYLMQHQSVMHTLQSLFEQLKSTEEKLHGLWSKQNLLFGGPVENGVYDDNFTKYEEKHKSLKLEFNRRTTELGIPTIMALLSIFSAESIISVMRKTRGQTWTSSLKSPAAWGGRLGALGIMALLCKLTGVYSGWRALYKNYSNIADSIKDQLIALRELKHVTDTIHESLENNPDLTALIGSCDALAAFSTMEDEDMETLFKRVNSDTFQKPGSFFRSKGGILQTLPLFLKIRSQFAAPMQEIGKLEAYVSIARFMLEKDGHRASWCFPEYLERKHPYIDLQEFSHPLLDPEIVVLNSITLGNDGTYGAVVTGPNASGKSVSIRGIALSLILGQTLGVCPARVARFTPMAKFLTYLNPVDSIAQGLSRFQAEEKHIKHIIDTVDQLPKDQFAFVVTDELFSSTAPKEGEAASWGVAYHFSLLPNCMPIMATHFIKMTTLPQHTHGFFANYHVSVKRDSEGNIVHPFKLETGRSHQVIAIELARKAGFDKDLLDEADAFLERQGITSGRTI